MTYSSPESKLRGFRQHLVALGVSAEWPAGKLRNQHCWAPPKHLRFIIPLILGGFLATEHSETCCLPVILVTAPKWGCVPQSETIADLRSQFRSIWEVGSFSHSSPCCSTLFSASVSFTSALLLSFLITIRSPLERKFMVRAGHRLLHVISCLVKGPPLCLNTRWTAPRQGMLS